MNATIVSFAGEDWSKTELGVEIDRLLALQERDEHLLSIREEVVERSVKNSEEGAEAIRQMESELAGVESQFQILVARREQAQNENENENELLNLVAVAG